MRETTIWTPSSVKKEGGGCAKADIALQPMVRQQSVSLQLVNSGADSYLQLMEDPMPQEMTVPEEGHDCA